MMMMEMDVREIRSQKGTGERGGKKVVMQIAAVLFSFFFLYD